MGLWGVWGALRSTSPRSLGAAPRAQAAGARQCRQRALSALRVSGDGATAETVSPACWFTDFATLGSSVILPILCVPDLIVPLLFSLKKISKNC